jgi:hypothetical protein
VAGLFFLAALVYFLLFHRYGFFLQDEGTIAYQALRVAEGDLPYADFQTAYTPAGYYLHALIFRLAGPSLAVLRVTAALGCAITAALLFLASRQVLPLGYALLPAILWVLFEDQESLGYVVHTMAYPARYVSTLWAASLCLALSHARRPRRRLVVGLGLVTAAIISLKHTAGAYNAWAVGLGLILTGLGADGAAADARVHGGGTRGPLSGAARGDDPATAAPGEPGTTAAPGRPESLVRVLPALFFRVLPALFLLAVLAALPALFGGFAAPDPVVTIVFTLPIAAAVLVVVRHAWPWRRWPRESAAAAALARTGADLAVFGAAALLPTAGWILYFGSRAGFELLGRRLVFEGAAVARSYAIPFPEPAPAALGLLAVAGMVAAARVVSRRNPRTAAGLARAAGIATAALAVAGLAWAGTQVRSLVASGAWLAAGAFIGRQADNAAFYAVPVIGYALLPALTRACRRRSGAADPVVAPALPVVLCWVHALCQILLAYPRLDVAHLYEGLVTPLIVGTLLLARTGSFLAAASPPSWRAVRTAGALALGLMLAVKVAPRIGAQLDWHGGPARAPRTMLAGPRGGLYETRSWLAAVNRTAAFVSSRTSPDTPIFAYPAMAGIYFLSERHNPTEMDYFHRGFGEGRDEVAVIETLEREQVPLVVFLEDNSFDPPERGYFPMVKDYLARHFVQQEFFPPFQVLGRVAAARGADVGSGPAGRALDGAPPTAAPAAAAIYADGIANGDFASGDLRGFRAEAIEGGSAEVVAQGATFSALPGSAEIPFPGGPGSHAVKLRSRGDGTPGSVAILTSLPFVPGDDTLSLRTFSESTAVHFEVLLLDPAADTLEPSDADVHVRHDVPVDASHTNRAAGFASVRIPLPRGRGRPLKLQLRQQTLEPMNGYFTLITDIRAGDRVASADGDADGVADLADNCPGHGNPRQTNSDGDRFGDACDNCPYEPNDDQADADGDGIGNRCTIDIDGNGFTDAGDVAAFAAAVDGVFDARCDLDGSGHVDLFDLSIFSRAVRIGIASSSTWDFTLAFVDHSIGGGMGVSIERGHRFSSIPGSDLIAFPGPAALLVRSDPAGNPGAEGVLTSRPFVPRGPRLVVRALSESPDVAATVRVLRATGAAADPAPGDVLVEQPLVNDAPGSGPGARFQEQILDLRPWFDAEVPLASQRVQVQFRQHTTRAGAGFFTLIGDVRTVP